MYDILTIGSATRDVFLQSKAWEVKEDSSSPTGFEQCLPLGAKVPIEDIHFTTGGGATNAAVTFARMGGLRVATVCRIGEDSGAEEIRKDLRRERVDAQFVQRDARMHTGTSLILLSGSGERTILVYRGASGRLAAREVPWARIHARWSYVTSLNGDLALFRKILAHAEGAGARVAWNPGNGEIAKGWNAIAPLAARCAVFNVNAEEAATLTRRSAGDIAGMLDVLSAPTLPVRLRPHASRLTPHTSRLVLLTDGPRGAYVRSGPTTMHIASRSIRAVNTTGAGDAFGSAFVVGLMRIPNSKFQISNLAPALRLAMANAEGVITHMGAKTGILRRIPGRSARAKYRVRMVSLLR